MDNRDIFDEEFDRLSLGQDEPQNQFDSWSGGYNVYQQPEPKRQHRPLKIVLTALLMVVCIALGWVLAVITTDNGSDGDDTRKEILNDVIDHMDYNFYEEITDEEWQLAVEQAGSALMQYAGDQFSFLMSPQTYYNYMENVSSTLTAASSMNELFGMTYQMESKGMLVTDVMPDSATYGYLQAGDLIVKLDNIKEYIPILDANGNLQQEEDGSLKVQRDSNKKPVLRSAANEFVLEGLNANQAGWYLQFIYSADFYVLRDGSIYMGTLTRNKVGIPYDEKSIDPKKRYDFKFVEYYFGDDATNISVDPHNGASVSTYQLRGLNNMPANAGYVRIAQFDQTDLTGKVSCYTELKSVLEMFAEKKLNYLILDLKGNPGGYVDLTVNIAGMLIHPNNLTAEQKSKVEADSSILGSALKNEYVVTTLVPRNDKNKVYSTKSSYYNYFPQTELADGKKRIIVWTDGGSASASELLTGTLLDYGTAVQMGTNTYGKGIAQWIEPLGIKGSYVDKYGNLQTSGEYATWAVYYTFASYYSPLGTNIQNVGYAPATGHQASSYSDLWTLARRYWGI